MSNEAVKLNNEAWHNDLELVRERMSKIGTMGGRMALHEEKGESEANATPPAHFPTEFISGEDIAVKSRLTGYEPDHP